MKLSQISQRELGYLFGCHKTRLNETGYNFHIFLIDTCHLSFLSTSFFFLFSDGFHCLFRKVGQLVSRNSAQHLKTFNTVTLAGIQIGAYAISYIMSSEDSEPKPTAAAVLAYAPI